MSTPHGEPGPALAAASSASARPTAPPWQVVARPDRPAGGAPRDPSARRVVVWVAVVALLVIVAVAVAALVAARRLAEAESVADAADRADRISDALLEPALTDALVDGDPEARAEMDAVVRDHVLSDSIVRVKIWDETGLVVWSDESRLIGERFELGEEDLEALLGSGVESEVTDLTEPENVYERGEGRLLEAYRSVRTTSGQPLLAEVYFRYDEVVQRSGQIWAGFAGITIGSIVLVVLLLLPVLARLLRALQASRRHREALLERALDASAAERRRIAGALHDGVVQDLVATSLAVSAGSAAARGRGDDAGADGLDAVATTVRGSVSALRTLLVDIYPPSLAEAGLEPALADLVAAARARGVPTRLVVDPVAARAASPDEQRLVFRVVQECLVNVVKHSRASSCQVVVEGPGGAEATGGSPGGAGGLLVTVADDGVGFDPALLADPERAHFGLRVLRDLAVEAGASLELATAPGAGTRWRLTGGAP